MYTRELGVFVNKHRFRFYLGPGVYVYVGIVGTCNSVISPMSLEQDDDMLPKKAGQRRAVSPQKTKAPVPRDQMQGGQSRDTSRRAWGISS